MGNILCWKKKSTSENTDHDQENIKPPEAPNDHKITKNEYKNREVYYRDDNEDDQIDKQNVVLPICNQDWYTNHLFDNSRKSQVDEYLDKYNTLALLELPWVKWLKNMFWEMNWSTKDFESIYFSKIEAHTKTEPIFSKDFITKTEIVTKILTRNNKPCYYKGEVSK